MNGTFCRQAKRAADGKCVMSFKSRSSVRPALSACFIDTDGAMFTLLNSASDPADADAVPEGR